MKKSVAINYCGYNLTIEGKYEVPIDSFIGADPEHCYPASGGFVEIDAVYLEGTDIYDLIDHDINTIYALANEAMK